MQRYHDNVLIRQLLIYHLSSTQTDPFDGHVRNHRQYSPGDRWPANLITLERLIECNTALIGPRTTDHAQYCVKVVGFEKVISSPPQTS